MSSIVEIGVSDPLKSGIEGSGTVIRTKPSSPRPTYLASPEQLIDEARNGRMFILVDDEDPRSEGHIVIAAQMATPDAINFMATHARGLICLALTKARVEALGLHLMATLNVGQDGTAFAVSIEAREGVTTGISAADRARTIAVAVDSSRGADDLVTPGHVFPLVGRDGGVLVRAGHAEAAIDIARLAGLNPSGVVCEIMNEDGTMARLDDLVAFAQHHGLKIGTIRDLISYRRLNDHLVERKAEVKFRSEWGGDWRAITYWNTVAGSEQFALVKGDIDPKRPTLVRIHVLSPFTDVFGEGGDRGGLLRRSMSIIGEEGAGVVVVINAANPDRLTRIFRARAGTLDPHDVKQLRDYGVGAMILTELGVHDMVLLTNTHQTLVALAGYGLSIVGERPIPPQSS